MTLMFKDHTGAEHDFDALPASTRQGMVNRAVSHIFGNECASVVVGKIKAALANGGKASDVTTAQVQAYRADASHEAQLDAWLAEARDAKIAAIVAGSLGVRVAGPSIDPLESMIHRIAVEELQIRLKHSKTKVFPTKFADDFVFVDPRGVSHVGPDGQAAVVAKYLAANDVNGMFGKKGEPNGPRIERLAKRRINEKKEKAALQAAAAEVAPDELGL